MTTYLVPVESSYPCYGSLLVWYSYKISLKEEGIERNIDRIEHRIE
jgi:hypothetical protein